jgi:hypothetical protein
LGSRHSWRNDIDALIAYQTCGIDHQDDAAAHAGVEGTEAADQVTTQGFYIEADA